MESDCSSVFSIIKQFFFTTILRGTNTSNRDCIASSKIVCLKYMYIFAKIEFYYKKVTGVIINEYKYPLTRA